MFNFLNFNSDKHIINIMVKKQLTGEKARIFNDLLIANEKTGKTSKELVEFMFDIGFEFIHGALKGFAISQSEKKITNINIEEIYSKIPIMIDTIKINDTVVNFFIMKGTKELCIFFDNKWHRMSLINNYNKLEFMKPKI